MVVSLAGGGPLCSQDTHPAVARGWRLLDSGQYQAAVALCQEELRRTDQDATPLLTAALLNIRGNAERQTGQVVAALATHRQVLALRSRWSKDPLPIGNALLNVANCHLDLIHLDEASRYLEQAGTQFKKAPGRPFPEYAHLALSRGNLRRLQERYREAEAEYREALAGYQEQYGEGAAQTLLFVLELAEIALLQEAPAKAEGYLRAFAGKSPLAPELEARYKRLFGQWQELERKSPEAALPHLEAAWQYAKDRGEEVSLRERTLTALALGETLHKLGDYEAAARVFSEIRQSVSDESVLPVTAGSIALNQGMAFHRLGRLNEAKEALLDAIRFLEPSSAQQQARAYFQLAQLYAEEGYNGYSLIALEETRRLAGNKDPELRASAALLNVRLSQSPEEAKRYYQEAETWMERQASLPRWLTLALALAGAEIAEQLGDWPLAERRLEGIERLLGKGVGDFHPQMRLAFIITRTRIYHRQAKRSGHAADWQRAADAGAAALEVLSGYQSRIEGRSNLLYHYLQGRPVFEALVEAHYALSRGRDRRHLAKAFTYAEMSKAYLLRRLLWQAEVNSFAGVPQLLLDRELRLRRQIDRYIWQDAAASGRGISEQQGALEDIRRQLERESSLYARLLYQLHAPEVDWVQQRLEKDQCLVSYFSASEVLYAFVINEEGLFAAALPGDRWQEETAAFVGQLSRGSIQEEDIQELAQSGQWLYQRLIRPLEAPLRPRLIISADDKLHYLPFEALLVRAPADLFDLERYPYLVHRRAISYTYGASLLPAPGRKQRYPHKLMVAALTYPGGEGDLEELTFAQKEARQVQNNLGWPGKVLKEDQVTKEELGRLARESGIAHLIMHGIIDDQRHEHSHLLLGRTREGVREQLTMEDIYQQKWPLALVFLSACRSGNSALYAGEGMMSLARAFFAAGAASLVSTLWYISDQQTALFAPLFYRQLATGQPKDKALQAAKSAYLKGNRGKAAHPYFWAGVMLYGEVTPIGQSGPSWLPWIIGTGSILALAGAALYAIQVFFRTRKARQSLS